MPKQFLEYSFVITQIVKDSASDPSMKTRTHSQAPARKRNRKGSWGGLKMRVLARIHAASDSVFER